MESLKLIKIQKSLNELEEWFPLNYQDAIIGIEEKETKTHIYFDTDIQRSIFSELLKNSPHLTNDDWELEDLEARDWNAEWEASFTSININDECLIRSSFHTEEKNYPYEIIIDPKMAFGTGHHETTHMMIAFMLEEDLKAKKLYDCGTGTGILAIQAYKMGAKPIVAIDNDKWAFENASQNFTINKVENVSLSCRGLKIGQEDTNYDIILANINRNVLLDYFAEFKRILDSNGILFISGILISDRAIINNALEEQGFQIIDEKRKGEWMALKIMIQ